MATQSLYRRYRPGKFSEVRGQEHVIRALRNAVAEGRHGHAYLFSGPRGTGKTTMARIMAKVLNCENPSAGEPCGVCDSCVGIEEGRSFDLHELDAASNNGVDAMRDLISKAVLGTPGRTKVYILDEVHMLSTGASNALLKTLEEPPDHVVFVLATTDPHKVLPTIRSRTQHLELTLLPTDQLADHVRWIIDDAQLDLGQAPLDEVVDYVIRKGGGSARDTLSALDQVVAAGGTPAGGSDIDTLVDALVAGDTGTALLGVAEATGAGREPRLVAEELIARLRDAFLVSLDADAALLTQADRERSADLAASLGAAGLTRGIETLGTAVVEMRQAPEPRIVLEVALVRLTHPQSELSLAALADRIERLERGAPPAGSSPASPTPAPAPELALGLAGAESLSAAEAPMVAPQSAEPAAPQEKPEESTPAPADLPVAAPPLPADLPVAAPPPPADLPVAAPPPPADRPEESTPPPADPVPDLPVAAEPLPAAAPPAPAPAPAPAAGAGPARAAREVLAQRGLLADKTPPILDKASAVTPTPPPPPGAARTIGAAKGTASDDLAPTPPPTAPPHAPGSNSPVFDDGTPLPAPPSDSDEPEPGPAPAVERQPAAPASSGDGPAVADVSATFDDLLSALSNKGRALLRPAQVVSSSAGKVVLGLPNEVHAQKAKEFGPELAAALSSRFGGALAVEFGVAGDPLPPAPSAPVAEAIAPPVERAPVGPQSVPPAPEPGAETPVSAPPPAVVEPPPPAPTPEPPTSSAPAPAVEPSASAGDSVDDFDPDTDIGNIADLADATDVASSYVDRLTEAFPGAEVVEPDQSPGGPS